MAWICERGVVLQSARGPVENVAQFIAGEPIRGSWWGHPAGKEIYAILTAIDESPEIVSTRLVDGKVTLVHARVWPSVVRVSERIGVQRLAAIHSEHTASGTHRTFVVEYPNWVSPEALRASQLLSIEEAFSNLPTCLHVT
jgi:hypothetical protein